MDTAITITTIIDCFEATGLVQIKIKYFVEVAGKGEKLKSGLAII